MKEQTSKELPFKENCVYRLTTYGMHTLSSKVEPDHGWFELATDNSFFVYTGKIAIINEKYYGPANPQYEFVSLKTGRIVGFFQNSEMFDTFWNFFQEVKKEE